MDALDYAARCRAQTPPDARARSVRAPVRDTRKAAVFTFVRRPGYYVAFNAGERIHEQQRYGLGLVWTPALGAVLQSLTSSDVAAWRDQMAAARSTVSFGNLKRKTHLPARHSKLESPYE